jgi:hypothetical protein
MYFFSFLKLYPDCLGIFFRVKRLNNLRQIKHLLDIYSLIRIYFAFIRPILEYGDDVWGKINDSFQYKSYSFKLFL